MKKQFFTTAIAFIAALSLSASAFAAGGGNAAVGYSEAGGSNLGSSTTGDVVLTDDVTKISGVINEELTVSAEVSKSLFPEYVSVSMDVSVADVAGEEKADLEAMVGNVLKSYWHTTAAPVVNQAFDITFTGKKADGTVVPDAQPAKSIKISFNTLDDSNAIFDVEASATSYVKALIGLARSTNGISSFKAPHFSTYYTVKVAPAVALALLGDEEGETNPGGNQGGNQGGNEGGSLVDPGTSNGSSDNNNNSSDNNNNSSDNNNSSNNNSGNGSFDIDFNGPNSGDSNNSSNTTGTGNDVTDNSNNNVGNTDGNGSGDKNQATGVVLAVVPAAVAAAAVIISKKRK